MKGKIHLFFLPHLLPPRFNAFIHSCALLLSTGICKETVVIMKTHKMLHYGWACAADAAACLWKRTCWIRVMMQGCGYYKASINAADPVKPHSADRKASAFVAIWHPFQSQSSTQHLHQKGRRVSFPCTDSAQIDPNQPSANIVLSNAPKCRLREMKWWHASTNKKCTITITAHCFECSIF